MLLDKQIDFSISENITKLETKLHKTNLFELVNIVQPGYFKNQTSEITTAYTKMTS